MIAYLKGKLAHKNPNFVIIECNGVGYQVRISLNTYTALGKEESVQLHTHLMIKDDAHELYGFKEQAEKSLFLQLIGISGVGGNTALTILSSMSAKELYSVIESEDLTSLKRVKGIGVKTAGRIILELKGKLVTEGSAEDGGLAHKARSEAIAALAALGLPKAAMEKRVDKLIKDSDGEITVEELVKKALQQ